MKFKKLSCVLSALLVAGSVGISKADSSFIRIAGNDRYATSRESQKYINSETVVFADGKNFADSLSAVNLIHAEGAKLYLVDGHEDLKNYIKENGIKKAYIVGGPNSVSEKFENDIKQVVPTERVYGENRYKTNIATLEKGKFTNVVLANGNLYTEPLITTRLLKEKNLGLMLTDSIKFKVDPKYKVEYFIGGETAITATEGDRINGIDDTETSKLIADKTDAKNWVIVSGKNFADALSAINISEAKGADILIAPEMGDKDYTGINTDGKIYVVGGENALPDAQINYVLNHKGQREENTVREENYDDVVVNNENGFSIKKKAGKYYAFKGGERVVYNKKSNGIYKVGNKAYMIATDNSVYNGKFNVGKDTYYSDIKEGLARGWKNVNNKFYYFSPYNYKMYKNGVYTTGRNVYWFDENGITKNGSKKAGRGGKYIRWYAATKPEMVNPDFNNPEYKNLIRNQEAANFALRFEGLPFRWYGSDLTNGKGVYCCGAAYSAMKSIGVKIPGPNDMNVYSAGGYEMVKQQYVNANKYGGKYLPINLAGNTLYAGDLLYSSGFNSYYNHVAIYLGKNHGTPYVVHASLGSGFGIDNAYLINNVWRYKNLKAIRY